MPDISPAIAVTVRAIGGESNLDALMPALVNERLARVIALAPGAHHLVRAVAALCGGLPSVPDAPTIADPALHDAVAQTIGTRAGRDALRAWTEVAPVAWGAAHAAALITAVHAAMCDASVAAALIGPGNASVALPSAPWTIAFAIRRWGQANPDDPTAWATALAPAERDRLIATALSSPFACASCLPWLPPDVAWSASDDRYDDIALDAFAAASPTVRTQHAAILPRLVVRAHPMHLAALTRLACVMQTDEIWSRVQTLIQASPDDAWRVVAAAPWDDLPEDVRAAILERAAPSHMMSAIRAARGQGDPATIAITYGTAAAFFAALAPRVWDALDPAVQQRWRNALWRDDVHLAVRSIGARTEILARAKIGNTLVRAAQRHGLDAHALRWALLPVALRRRRRRTPARSSSSRAGAMTPTSSRPHGLRCARPPISHARSRCSAAGTSSCRFTITPPRFGTRCADGRGTT